MLQDKIQAKGVVYVTHTKADGTTYKYTFDNLVVTTGRNHIAARLGQATPPTAMSHMAIGAGVIAPALTDTQLGNQLARVTLTSTTVTNNIVRYVASFAPGVGTGAVTEAGIFNAATGGTMLNRVTFPVVNKESGDSIAVTWDVEILSPAV